MRILFNLVNTGLGNNGGSLTIIKSANVLTDLGHEVILVDTIQNMNTWQPLRCEHMIIESPSEIPDGDVIISTGMKTLESTNESKIENKFHWIRGWETWVYPEETLVKMFQDSPTVKLVNSICLQRKLANYGMGSYIVRPGYDFDMLHPSPRKESYGYTKFGGLYNTGKKRKGKRTEWIPQTIKKTL